MVIDTMHSSCEHVEITRRLHYLNNKAVLTPTSQYSAVVCRGFGKKRQYSWLLAWDTQVKHDIDRGLDCAKPLGQLL